MNRMIVGMEVVAARDAVRALARGHWTMEDEDRAPGEPWGEGLRTGLMESVLARHPIGQVVLRREERVGDHDVMVVVDGRERLEVLREAFDADLEVGEAELHVDLERGSVRWGARSANGAVEIPTRSLWTTQALMEWQAELDARTDLTDERRETCRGAAMQMAGDSMAFPIAVVRLTNVEAEQGEAIARGLARGRPR